MTVQIKDANGATQTVSTADDIIAALTAQATPTSAKGSPTTQMLTVQPGNDFVDLGTVTQAFNAGTAIFAIAKVQGSEFQTLVVSLEAIASGASVTVRARQTTNESWTTLRAQQAIANGTSGSVTVGGLFYFFIPYKFVEVIQSGGSSGNTIATALLFRGAPPVREVNSQGHIARSANGTTNNGSTGQATMTLYGAAVVKPFSIPEADWTSAAASGGIVNTTDVTLAAAAGAGIRNYLTSIDIANTHASVDTEVVVKDGSTVLWRRKFKAGDKASFHFNTPLKGSANTALNVACITTGSEVYVNAQGYVAV